MIGFKRKGTADCAVCDREGTGNNKFSVSRRKTFHSADFTYDLTLEANDNLEIDRDENKGPR